MLFRMAGLAAMACVGLMGNAAAEDFGAGARRTLLRVETAALPRGKMLIEAGERAFQPGQRGPWYTAPGPKLLYLLEGTLTVVAEGGKVLQTCGPEPKMCMYGPFLNSWFLRNDDKGVARALVIGLDPAGNQTSQEVVGQVIAMTAGRVIMIVGNPNVPGVSEPRQEISVAVADVRGVRIGDHVMTQRFDERRLAANSLVRLSPYWQ